MIILFKRKFYQNISLKSTETFVISCHFEKYKKKAIIVLWNKIMFVVLRTTNKNILFL